eukprot:CAMPEP_0197234494 /NCGR_PEP_ID=MMETSP1429-20130617/2233_1 /TAXON_ID=49237 /ORGANISM="Chaetoceros  sp., Strain UNC1202" /LENGTH=150 /DNA_ID=CAMNT_0042692917 /DNA_START=45 /DNA_END=497 /DNA_ORIENTATION=-
MNEKENISRRPAMDTIKHPSKSPHPELASVTEPVPTTTNPIPFEFDRRNYKRSIRVRNRGMPRRHNLLHSLSGRSLCSANSSEEQQSNSINSSHDLSPVSTTTMTENRIIGNMEQLEEMMPELYPSKMRNLKKQETTDSICGDHEIDTSL